MLRALFVGALAALRSPLWLRGRRVEGLLDRSAGPAGSVEPSDKGGDPGARRMAEAQLGASWSSDPEGDLATARRVAEHPISLGIRAARAATHRLSRLPRSPWRNTCLYKSIAECLVLRHYGIPAQIRIGVRNEAPPDGPIVAHAWVVYPGYVETENHIPLAPSAGLLTPDFGAEGGAK